MIIIAASLYLPEHISTTVQRAWFYWGGEEGGVGASIGRAGIGSSRMETFHDGI